MAVLAPIKNTTPKKWRGWRFFKWSGCY